MKYRLSFIFLLSFFAVTAQVKTGIINGKVTPANGGSAKGIPVNLKNTQLRTLTDESGSFVITAPEGTYTLIVGAGTQTEERTVDVKSSQVVSLEPIRLIFRQLNLEEVVVTGQFEPQSLKNSVYRVRTISNERIRLRAATNLENVLNTELGIRFSNDLTLGEADIQLMGMSGQNVKVLIDGVPVVERGATRQSISQIDVNTIERIEIVEGPMSVIYGTDALAGVINLITKKGTGSDELSVSARLQEETVGNEYRGFVDDGTHNGNLGVNWQKNNWQFSASGTRNNFGGWTGGATGRQKEWNPKDQWLANGRIGYRNSNFNAWYRLDYLDETIYSRGQLNINNYRARDQNYLSSRYTHQLQAEWLMSSKLNFTAAASYQDYNRRTHTTILDATTGTRTLSTGAGEQDRAGFDTKFFRGTFQYKISPKVSLQPGVEVNLSSGSGERILGTPQINDYALFVSSEIIPAAGVSIRPGLRFSENSVYSAPRAIPSLNTKFSLGKDFDLRLAYARGFRAPALRELYFNFFDASHSIQGNQNLEAEFSNSFNGYLSWQSAGNKKLNISSTLGAFYNRFTNQITTGYLPGNNTVVTYINIENFRTQGATFENKFQWKDVQAMLGFSYIGRFNRLSETASLPEVMWTPEVNSNLMYTLPKLGANISVFYKLTGKRPAYEVRTINGVQGVALTEIAGFNMADLTASKIVSKNLTLTAGVKNLFNVTRVQNTSTDTGGAHSTGGPVPVGYGRSFFLGMNMQWSRINR